MIMAVRRHAVRLATIGALLGGLVALGGSPALADDQVRVRSAGSFTAGGSAEGVAVEVRRRTDGCVLLRTALGLRLAGLRADQARVQVSYNGQWFPVPLGGGGGSVASSATSPPNPRLCKGKSITVRYRVSFTAAAPSGRLTVTAEATSAMGQVLGRGADASRVVGGRATASPTPSKKPSPTPSAVATEEAAEDVTPVAALANPASNAAEESSGFGSVVMFFGIAMVAVGILLIVLLFRRSRADKEQVDAVPPVPLPGNPGGTTYRSGQGPAAAGVRPGQVYGQQPPATGAVYGGPPAPRPTGGVYGGRPTPEATQVMPGRHAAPTPPVSGPPTPPLTSPAAPVSGPPTERWTPDPPVSGPPTERWTPTSPVPGPPSPSVSGPPADGWAPTSPVSGPPSRPVSPPAAPRAGWPEQPAPRQPGASPAAPTSAPPGQPGDPPEGDGGGDHTVFMPRLPG
ncbi:hypothetical protein ACGFJ5_00035 [Micromonospora echinaurantiaca]|uniref:hypothetical protein n=1 Tax=Micromonospora echinaurantiaca TaxID=47857 RepID=UPI00371D0B46